MTKSKKNNRKSRKNNRKSRQNNRKSRQNNITIDNTGLTEFIYKEGKQSPKKTVFEWNGNYDGKNAKIHMDLEVDGKKSKTDLQLSNRDLMNILGSTAVVEQPLDQRLQSLDNDLSIMYPQNNIPEPIFIHVGEMPMNMNEMPLNMNAMSLENAISKSNHDVKKSKSKSKSKR